VTQRQAVDEQCAELTVRERLNQVALERDLRPSTRIAYQRCMTQLGILDELVSSVTIEAVTATLWTMTNPNTRRGAAIAARSVLGFKIRIGKSVPRRYTLPSEDTLRLALMQTPHETRALLMMFCGLRLGEACAVTRDALSGDRLRVDRQIQTLRETGCPTITGVAQVKSSETDVVIPAWLADQVRGLTGTVTPDAVRESLRRAGQKVGIKLNPHLLRHWCITTMIDRGLPLELVRQQARHSDLSITLGFYQEFSSQQIHEVFPG
jgi:integrase